MLTKVLLVEDNMTLAKMICHLLKQEKIDVDCVEKGEDALEYVTLKEYDVVILDWMLPGISGLEVCHELRKNGYSSGIIMLTARGEKEDKIEGLNTGADDYVTKPFDFEELMARIKSVARRGTKPISSCVLDYGNVKLDSNRFIVEIDGKTVGLSNKEFKLLELLISNKEAVVTRETIFNKIWNNENGVMPNTLDVYIKMLRNKLESSNSNVKIKTIRGFGYRLENEESK